jgi:hypothetical protein
MEKRGTRTKTTVRGDASLIEAALADDELVLAAMSTAPNSHDRPTSISIWGEITRFKLNKLLKKLAFCLKIDVSNDDGSAVFRRPCRF